MSKTRGGLITGSIRRAGIVAMTVTLVVLFLMGGAASAQSISLIPAEKTVTQGSETTFEIVMDSAPHGLAGYELNVSLSNPDCAEITSVTYPDWASLHKNGSFPADKVMISGVDLGHKVENGSKNIPLATIRIRGDSPGSTWVNISMKELDADGGSPINGDVQQSRLTIKEASAAWVPDLSGGTSESAYPPTILIIIAVVIVAGLSVLIYAFWMKKK